MKWRFTIWQLLFVIAAVAVVVVIWTSRLEHQKVESKLQIAESKLDSAQKQLDKTEYALLVSMRESIAKKSDPIISHGVAKEVAERIAINRPNDNYIWWVLTRTGGLNDGMSLSDAEAILGPATDASHPLFVYWYDSSEDDPSKLRAKRNEDKLVQWRIGHDSNFDGASGVKSLH